ncbi:MAG TPA: A24 family peptidase [Caproicibacter sp.]|nr:A24 family peptidase [Caproicibacter sp.]
MIYLLGAALAGVISDYFFNLNYPHRRYPCTVILTVLSCVILLKAFDDPLLIIKGLIFSQALIFIGYSDGKTHIIPNLMLLPVIASGFINFQPLTSLVGLISVSSLLFVVAWLSHLDGAGGGDVKLAAATGFVLGPAANLAGTFIGFILFLIAYFSAFHRQKKMYAMAPWLGAGCFIAYILSN